MKIKSLLLLTSLLFSSTLLVSCGGGSSDSGSGSAEVTMPGNEIPANFVGVYQGTINLKAEAVGLSESDSFPITITVNSNGTIDFKDEDSGESFSVGITNEGDFSGTLSENISEDGTECSLSLSVSGSVNGSNANGDISGDGECSDSGLTLDVDVSGNFNATKQ